MRASQYHNKKVDKTKFAKTMKKIKEEMGQLGQAGGKKTLKKYGKKHFRELAKKRWLKAKAKKKHD